MGKEGTLFARVHQYSNVPSWYKGSLKGLQDLVSRKVHSKYPSIKSEKKKKSASYTAGYYGDASPNEKCAIVKLWSTMPDMAQEVEHMRKHWKRIMNGEVYGEPDKTYTPQDIDILVFQSLKSKLRLSDEDIADAISQVRKTSLNSLDDIIDMIEKFAEAVAPKADLNLLSQLEYEDIDQLDWMGNRARSCGQSSFMGSRSNEVVKSQEGYQTILEKL